MNSTETLRAAIIAYCKKHDMSGSRFSQLAVGDPSWWHKFERGRVPKLDMYDRIMSFIGGAA